MRCPSTGTGPTVDRTGADGRRSRGGHRQETRKGAREMDIVTFAGTGRHVASWRYVTSATPSVGVAVVCEPQGMPQEKRPRVRHADLFALPTDPQRTSAPPRWSP